MDKPSWRAEIIDENAARQKKIEKMARMFDPYTGRFPELEKNNTRVRQSIWHSMNSSRACPVRPSPLADVTYPIHRANAASTGNEVEVANCGSKGSAANCGSKGSAANAGLQTNAVRRGLKCAVEPRVLVDADFIRKHGMRIPLSFTFEQSRDGQGSQMVHIPCSMVLDPELKRVLTRRQWQLLRIRHDFAYWAAVCVTIKDKSRGRRVPFILNYAQRRLLADFERQRLAGKPIRTIVLKARQWGGSTLTQIYMAWIQCVLTTDWHSLICTQVTRASATIRGMFDSMLASYPAELWIDEDQPDGNAAGTKKQGAAKPLRLVPFQGQTGIRTLPGRRCNITLGSAECQDAIRSGDYALAHLSEVAFWKETPQSSPSDFIRAICGSVAPLPLTMVVLESTANGMGNFFQLEWERSERGESDKSTLFVPWYDIDLYQSTPENPRKLWETLSEYEWDLWNKHGCTLGQIQWYRNKLREIGRTEKMHAEFPTTPAEAFINTGSNVFAPEKVELLRGSCRPPQYVGEISAVSGAVTGPDSLRGLSFSVDSTGCLQMWSDRHPGAAYVVSVDVGGRSRTADWSVILVLRTDGARPEVVAQWRGHTDHDLLTWNAARIATYYNHALLVFESNTLETADRYGEAPDQGVYILNELYEHYDNLYRRPSVDGGPSRPGFHTNRQTKQMIITELIAAVRDGLYVEHDHTTTDEYSVYQLFPNGSYGAREGFHDDCLMTRAIALHVARTETPGAYAMASNPDLAAFLRRRLG